MPTGAAAVVYGDDAACPYINPELSPPFPCTYANARAKGATVH
jgi:hypothetical protein